MADIEITTDFSDAESAAQEGDALVRAMEAMERAASSLERATDPLSRSLQRTGQSSQQAGASLGQAAAQGIQFIQRIQAAAGAVQSLAAAFGGSQAGGAGLIARIASSTAAFAQLGAAVGPGGAVVGGIVGALVPAFESLRQAELAAREEAHRLNVTLEDAIANAGRLLQHAGLRGVVTAGAGTTQQQLGYTEEQRSRYDLAVRALSGDEGAIREVRGMGLTGAGDVEPGMLDSVIARVTGGSASTLSDSERTLLEGIADRAAARVTESVDFVTDAIGREYDARVGGGGHRTSRGGGRAAPETSSSMTVAYYGEGQNAEAPFGHDRELAMAEQLAHEREARESIQQQEQAAYEAEMQHLQDLGTEREQQAQKAMDEADRVAEREQRAKDELHQAYEAKVSQYRETTSVLVSGLVTATTEVAKGTKSADEAFKGMLASFLQFIAEKAALKAADEYAEAIASFASYNYAQGAQHLAAGAAFTALAVASGVGSGLLAQKPAAATEGPASPITPGRERGGGDRTVVINWNSPVVTAGTRADLGRELGSLVEAGASRYGGH